jgi:hypothetical protein
MSVPVQYTRVKFNSNFMYMLESDDKQIHLADYCIQQMQYACGRLIFEFKVFTLNNGKWTISN